MMNAIWTETIVLFSRYARMLRRDAAVAAAEERWPRSVVPDPSHLIPLRVDEPEHQPGIHGGSGRPVPSA
jgi:hypothetical protein